MTRRLGHAKELWPLAVVASLAVGGVARADVPVLAVSRAAELDQPFFEVDARTGAAWLVLYLVDPGLDIGFIRDGYRRAPVRVPGLGYDARTSSVVFAEAGHAPVVCARLVPARFLFFHYTKLEETGACGVTRLRDEPGPPYPGLPSGHATRRVVYFGRTR